MPELPPKDHHEQDDEIDEGKGIQDVHHTHHGRIDATSGKATDEAVRHADARGDGGGEQANGQRDASTLQDAGEHVASERVRAQPMRGAGA